MNVLQVQDALFAVGQSVVHCCQGCPGVHSDRAQGILPRGLVFDPNPPDSGRGCIVVGINPARAPKHEQARLRDGSYPDLVRYWNEVGWRHKYHQRIRDRLIGYGFNGPLYWTDLVKCQNAATLNGLPPLQTIRTCITRYLRAEMTMLPAAWPLIGIGRTAFILSATLFPERTVLGLPHPSGKNPHSKSFYSKAPSCELRLPENAAPTVLWVADIPCVRYRVIECRVDDEDWGDLEVVFEDPELGVTRFRPRSRHAFRRCEDPIESISAEVAREFVPGVQAELRISPIYVYFGPFEPLEPDILFELEHQPASAGSAD